MVACSVYVKTGWIVSVRKEVKATRLAAVEVPSWAPVNSAMEVVDGSE
jgi:hypothetical protein